MWKAELPQRTEHIIYFCIRSFFNISDVSIVCYVSIKTANYLIRLHESVKNSMSCFEFALFQEKMSHRWNCLCGQMRRKREYTSVYVGVWPKAVYIYVYRFNVTQWFKKWVCTINSYKIMTIPWLLSFTER